MHLVFCVCARRESHTLGTTDFVRSDLEGLVNQMGEEWTGDKYHLLRRNCNHFTAEFSKVLITTSLRHCVTSSLLTTHFFCLLFTLLLSHLQYYFSSHVYFRNPEARVMTGRERVIREEQKSIKNEFQIFQFISIK